MIKSFKDKGTEKVFSRILSRKLPQTIQQTAYRKLRMINNSIDLEDLRLPPANRLEKLKGDQSEQFSIRVNIQWRIYFEWLDGAAYSVEIADYH